MTVLVAAAGFVLVSLNRKLQAPLINQIQDAPGMAKVFWMSGEDDEISRWRLDRAKKLPSTVSHPKKG